MRTSFDWEGSFRSWINAWVTKLCDPLTMGALALLGRRQLRVTISSVRLRCFALSSLCVSTPLCDLCRLDVELKPSDSGLYQCLAVSETGETSWTSELQVRRPSASPTVVFHRMPDASTFPSSPRRPSVILAADASVLLSWEPSDDHGASPINSFTVEYFSQHSSSVRMASIQMKQDGQWDMLIYMFQSWNITRRRRPHRIRKGYRDSRLFQCFLAPEFLHLK